MSHNLLRPARGVYRLFPGRSRDLGNSEQTSAVLAQNDGFGFVTPPITGGVFVALSPYAVHGMSAWGTLYDILETHSTDEMSKAQVNRLAAVTLVFMFVA